MEKRREHFNFRDVLLALGVPPVDTPTNWKAGQVLRTFAADHGVEPLPLLTEKTDPNPTVAAPHHIAHYPMHLFPAAIEHLREYFEADRRQGQLPL
jgi:hypothetical protein